LLAAGLPQSLAARHAEAADRAKLAGASSSAANAFSASARVLVPVAVNEGSRRPFIAEMLRLIGAAANIEWQVNMVPWTRALLMAERGQVMVFGASRTPSRELLFEFSEPAFNNHVWMVVRRDQGLEFRSLNDLQGRVLCLARGISYGPAFDAAKGVLFRVEFSDGDLTTRVRMLMAGRCDVMLNSHRSSQPWLIERRLREESGHSAALMVLPTPMQVDPVHFMAARGHALAQLMPRLNAAMRQQARAIQDLLNSDL
jgi:polar amino acid transport system substrate-binding protein